MKDRYIATVDLGTGKLALSVAKITGEDVQILYYKEEPSDGVRYGRIFNPVRAAAPLKHALSAAEEELGLKIHQVVIGLPRFGVRQETASASTQRSEPDSCITQEEIDSVKNMALDTYPLEDSDREKMYGAVAQSFSTEDALNYSEEDVVGMPSSSLEGNFKVFVGAKKAVSNIDIMLNNAGVTEACKYFLPSSTADAVLTGEEKENGVALIEMGAGVTSVTIYQDNILRYYYAIPFGGKSITTDIKYECGFTEKLAENIKLAFGACMPERLQNMSDKVLQINDEEDGTAQQLSVKYLSEIISARVKEIVDAILFKIQDSGYADKLRNGIVLTGGGANLVNCSSLIKQMSGYNVRIGYPKARRLSSSGCPGIGETGAAATVGMLLLAISDTHIDCADEKNSIPKENPIEFKVENPSPRKAAKKAPKVEEEPAPVEEKIFEDKEWGEPVAKPKPVPVKKPKNGRIFTWTKKITESIRDSMGTLYDGMEDN